MTQHMTGAQPAPPQPPTIDQARLKLRSDIEQTKVQLSQDPSPSPAKLNQIIINTVLSLLGDVVEIDVHDHRSNIGIAGDIDRRLTAVEDIAYEEGEGDGVSDELARKIVLCASQSLALAAAALEADPNAEAKSQLEAHMALCNDLVEAFTLEDDDGADGESAADAEAES